VIIWDDIPACIRKEVTPRSGEGRGGGAAACKIARRLDVRNGAKSVAVMVFWLADGEHLNAVTLGHESRSIMTRTRSRDEGKRRRLKMVLCIHCTC
jgi:hypothetical protein